jgi:hypothetical protein
MVADLSCSCRAAGAGAPTAWGGVDRIWFQLGTAAAAGTWYVCGAVVAGRENSRRTAGVGADAAWGAGLVPWPPMASRERERIVAESGAANPDEGVRSVCGPLGAIGRGPATDGTEDAAALPGCGRVRARRSLE